MSAAAISRRPNSKESNRHWLPLDRVAGAMKAMDPAIKSGKVKIALVGNSHAGHWLPALQVLAKRNGWTITTFLASRCNATDARLELYGGTQGCHDYGQWVLAKTRGDAFDLVITSDTAVAHLAGALGATTWVALKHVPDWRWLLNRNDSPWYPTMRLFRQPQPGDWESVFRDMARALREGQALR